MREVRGWAVVEAAQAAGRGIVFLTPHLGCSRSPPSTTPRGIPITVLYRPPRRRVLQEMIEAGRARPSLHLAAADLAGVRGLLKTLKRGEAVGLLPDQGRRKWAKASGCRSSVARPTHDAGRAAHRNRRGSGFRLGRAPAWRRWLPPASAWPARAASGDLKPHGNDQRRNRSAGAGMPGPVPGGYNRYAAGRRAEAPPVTGNAAGSGADR